MKRLVLLALALILVIGCTGCQQAGEQGATATDSSASNETAGMENLPTLEQLEAWGRLDCMVPVVLLEEDITKLVSQTSDFIEDTSSEDFLSMYDKIVYDNLGEVLQKTMVSRYQNFQSGDVIYVLNVKEDEDKIAVYQQFLKPLNLQPTHVQSYYNAVGYTYQWPTQ